MRFYFAFNGFVRAAKMKGGKPEREDREKGQRSQRAAARERGIGVGREKRECNERKREKKWKEEMRRHGQKKNLEKQRRTAELVGKEREKSAEVGRVREERKRESQQNV